MHNSAVRSMWKTTMTSDFAGKFAVLCSGVPRLGAEPEGFEPSIGLYNPITV
jgi:hypothetical protein